MAADPVAIATRPSWADGWVPLLPDPNKLKPSDVRIVYDRDNDTLSLLFARTDVPTIGMAGGRDLLFRVDPATGETLGFEIEHMVSAVVYEAPELIDALGVVGFAEGEIARLRRQVRYGRHAGIIVDRLAAMQRWANGHAARPRSWTDAMQAAFSASRHLQSC